jgi:hypothetical protein
MKFTQGGFAPSNLGEEYNVSRLPISRGIYSQGLPADIMQRQERLERGEFGSEDPQTFLNNLSRDVMMYVARAQTASGVPIRQDLEAPTTKLIPIDTPLRNKLPRTPGSSTVSTWYQQSSVGGGYGVNTTVTSGTSSATQTVGSTAGMEVGTSLYFATTNAYRIVSSVTNATTVVLAATISTTTAEVVTAGPYQQPGQNPIQMFFAETGAPATGVAVYGTKTATYKLMGTIFSITGLAMAAGATFQNQLAEEKLAAIKRLMLAEENALINGDSTIVTAPWGDGSTAYAFDGVLALTTTANGTPGQQVQTSVGALTLAHVDAQLSRIHNQGGNNAYIIVNAQEMQSLVHLASASGSINRIMGTPEGKLVVGATISAYVHPITGQLVPVMTSRFMPAGTMWFGSEQGPEGMPAADVRVLPQVQLPELAPNQMIQGYVAQELAPAITSPQVYPGIVSCYEVLRMKNANVFAKSSGISAV